jgi:hypothetical protein
MFRFHRRSWPLWAGLAIAAGAACNRPQPVGTEPAHAVEKTTETRAETEERAVPEAFLRERLTASLAHHPQPFLALRSVGALSELRPLAGKPVALRVAMPGVQSWKDVGVTRLAVRSAASQESLSIAPDATGAIGYKFASAGPALVMMCVGARNDTRSDAWQHASFCSKTILDVHDARRAAADSETDLITETGLPIEVVPLKSPVGLPVGSELPASFHFMNEEQGGIEVAAVRPDGSVDRQVTNRTGIAYFAVSQPGRWVLRMVKPTAEGDRVGELVFEIAEGRR